MRLTIKSFLIFLVLNLISFCGTSQKNEIEERSHLFHFSYGYNYAPKNKTFATGGGRFSIGLNVSRLFSTKMFIGVTYSQSLLFSSSFNQDVTTDFKADFNNSLITSQIGAKDSAYLNTLRGGINKEDNFGITGSFCNSFGILFSPFPDRYGGVGVQLNYAFNRIGFYGVNNFIPSSEISNNATLSSIRSYQVELKFKPYFFAKKGRVNFSFLAEENLKSSISKLEFGKLFIVSIYFESLSYQKARFRDRPLQLFVKDSFINKYSKDYHFGIRLSLGFY